MSTALNTYLTTVFAVGVGWELPLLIVLLEVFIRLGCWPPPPPPPGPTEGFTEPRVCCPFWLDRPRMMGFSVLAVLILTTRPSTGPFF